MMNELHLYSAQGTIVVTALLPLEETQNRVFNWQGRIFVWQDNYGQHREIDPYKVITYRLDKAGK